MHIFFSDHCGEYHTQWKLSSCADVLCAHHVFLLCECLLTMNRLVTSVPEFDLAPIVIMPKCF